MRHFIIGTAGHVDHGKTCLIKALTGIDTDRLKEEKKRGITIDLGFANIDLPHFQKVGIVDVPGHERFIKNMLAGAGGIDFVMLVVAADEGVMPQTREHMDILTMLDMKRGMVVITKTDLVDEEFLSLVEEDIREEMKGTFLEDAPILKVSSHTGEGIEELKECLDEQLLKLEEKDEKKAFRLPVDRAFTLPGFGTVVTGTVIEGRIDPAKECMLYPDEIPVKIRGIQVHSQPAEYAYAGQRAAVNLAGIPKEAIRRGYVLAPVGSLIPTMLLDVRLDLLGDSAYSVKNNSRVHLYHGSAELLAKVVLMDRDILEPGQSCYAQLRLTELTSAKKGDRFVIRFYSPLVTIGGGVILDAVPGKKRRNQEAVWHGMEIKEKGTDKEKLYQAVFESSHKFCTLDELVRRGELNRQTVKNDRNKLISEGRILELNGEVYLVKEKEEEYRESALNMLRSFHREDPSREGIPLQEFRLKLLGTGREKDADALLKLWEDSKLLKIQDSFVSLYGFKVQRQEDDDELRAELVKLYQDAAFNLPTMEQVLSLYEGSRRFKVVLTRLLKDGTLIRLDEHYLIHREWYCSAVHKAEELYRDKKGIVLGDYRDLLNTSRKIALVLLDAFDRQGITKKDGDIRIFTGAGAELS